MPGGDQAAANVLKVVDVAQEFAGAGGGALRGFTNWLVRNRDEEEREVDAPVAEERDDIVRVMTIHAAKGLEFPIVALANVEWEGQKQVPPIPDAVDHRIHLTVGNDWARFQTPDWEGEKGSEKDGARGGARPLALRRGDARARPPGGAGQHGAREDGEGIHGEDVGVGGGGRSGAVGPGRGSLLAVRHAGAGWCRRSSRRRS